MQQSWLPQFGDFSLNQPADRSDLPMTSDYTTIISTRRVHAPYSTPKDNSYLIYTSDNTAIDAHASCGRTRHVIKIPTEASALYVDNSAVH